MRAGIINRALRNGHSINEGATSLFLLIAFLFAACSSNVLGEASTEEVSKGRSATETPSSLEHNQTKLNIYTAVITCSFSGRNINVMACFGETDLKITKGSRSSIYKAHELRKAGRMYSDGLHINLSGRFAIRAQNSSDDLTLGLKVIDEKNNVIYEDQAGKWGIVGVRG